MFSVVFHMLLGQSLRKRISSFVYSFSVFVVASVTFAFYNVAAGYSFTAYPPREWVLFALLALVPTVFGHVLFNWLIKYVGATTVSMAVLGEPVGASLLAWALLGESIGAIQAAAAALLILGVWLFLRLSGSRNEEAEGASEAAAIAAPSGGGGDSASPAAGAAKAAEISGLAVAGARETH
jgi:drug/metabolite transporter (DMT)-like permease